MERIKREVFGKMLIYHPIININEDINHSINRTCYQLTLFLREGGWDKFLII